MRNRPFLHLPLFVYGTLLPDQPNAYLWQDETTRIQPAQLDNSRLYDMGHYPMVIEAGDQPVIGCCLFIKPDKYEDMLVRLDHLEGINPFRPQAGPYRRVGRDVLLANGRLQTAWVYVGQLRLIANRQLITSGSWLAYIADRNDDGEAYWSDIDSVAGHFD